MLVECQESDAETSCNMLTAFVVSHLLESSVGLQVYRDGIVYKYSRLDFVSHLTPKLMATVGANLSGNYRCGLSKENHKDYYQTHMPRVIPNVDSREIKQCIDEVMSEVQGMPVSKITNAHHMFVSRHELREVMEKTIGVDDDSRRRLIIIIAIVEKSKELGFNNRVSVTTHLIYALTAPMFAVDHLWYILRKCSSLSEYNAELKFESQAAKQLQTLFRDDLSTVFELNVLFNRVLDDVDWRKERDNRVHPNTVQLPRGRVFDLACKIFQDGKREGKRARRLMWDEYWESRWARMPTGSTVSQYLEDRNLKAALPVEARVKAAWFSANRAGMHKHWIEREPMIYASTSTKYEWGKVRALYGCDVTSFLHADFAMADCEDTLPAYFPVGKRANDEYVTKMVETFTDGVPLCYDFDDFNSQHSTESMSEVLKAWQTVYGGSLTKEQCMSLRWTIDSLETQVVKYNELGETVEIKGTLLSGWRLTSFINTVLNRVYLNNVGLEGDCVYALHNGDDMYATTRNVKQAMDIVRRAKHSGVRAQLAKTNIGTIGEFLRVDTRAKVKTGAQYLARAVATAVHGRIEMAPANDYREFVKAMVTRASELKARGGKPDVVECIEKATVRFGTVLFGQTEQVASLIGRLHPLQGGSNVAADVAEVKLVARAESGGVEYERFALIKRGINDYANYVVKRLGIDFDMPARKEMFEKIVRSLMKKKVTYEIVVERDPYIRAYRGLYKTWSDGRFVNEIALARSLGGVSAKTLPGVKSFVAEYIRRSKDPNKMMSVIL